jgi:hypothetical protein
MSRLFLSRNIEDGNAWTGIVRPVGGSGSIGVWVTTDWTRLAALADACESNEPAPAARSKGTAAAAQDHAPDQVEPVSRRGKQRSWAVSKYRLRVIIIP